MNQQPSASRDDLKLGALVLANEQASPLPLEHTSVTGQIRGPVASVTVSQIFSNPYKDVIELAYLFPLPHQAAVTDYQIKIGQRIIRAEMKELEAARQAYQAALSEGKRASLLEQRRPNLFSIQIGNVQPGEKITASLSYQERLHCEDDHYEFVFPMGITPKYHANPAEAANVDAPLAADGERIGGVSLTLAVDAGIAAGNPASPSHTLNITHQDEHRLTVSLPDGAIPNKDFVLRYPIAGDAVQAAVWLSADGDADTALISLLPPRLSDDAEAGPREFIFVIDRSGSMSGKPIEQARNALRACLRAMGSGDTFMIQAFDNSLEWFSEKAQPVTQDAVNQADQWLSRIDARGGTEIVGAINAALAVPTDPSRGRFVIFLTDGAVSAHQQALAEIVKRRGNARIFTFGIGPSVNRSLLVKMAEFGRGRAEFLQLTEDIEDAITRFQDRVSFPALQDITLKWAGAESWDSYPANLPDLYIGQPLELTTRLKRTGPTTLTVSGTRGGQAMTLSMTIPATSTSDPVLRRLWARARVDSLLDQAANDDNVRQQVIGLAIEHRLLTPFTAFVAIDNEAAHASGESARRVNVAVPLPEGLDIDGFLGNTVARGITGVASRLGLVHMSAPAAPSPAPASAPNKDAPSSMRRMMGVESPRPASSVGRNSPPLPNMQNKAAVEKAPEPDLPSTLATLADRIKWLARTQNISGSWGSGADEAEMTAAALLAFVRAGHTTRSGNYRRQVRKAADWLKAASATGFAAFARFRALTELDAATQNADQFVTDSIRVGAPSSDPERAALMDAAVKLPFPTVTLDEVRVVALLAGEAGAPAELAKGAQAQLVAAWLAVGKPIAGPR